MSNKNMFPTSFKGQNQSLHPGIEEDMEPLPIYDLPEYINDGKRLKDKVAIITGGDSGIGRAVALAYAREGAKVCVIYLADQEDKDAEKTKELIEAVGGEVLLIKGDISNADFCNKSVSDVVAKWGKIDILVNNAAVQHDSKTLDDIGPEQLETTFKINVFGNIYMTKAAVKHMEYGSSIINTTSITAYRGNEILLDYSCTKGALTTLTRTLATMLVKDGIRVNAVAPGPIWTPLIPSSMSKKKVSEFGSNSPMGRAGQPVELAGAYVFLACNESSYISGITIHINGGEIING
ncbi:SDR family oxidoreductase [Clostridium sp. B9]|uniref:SDR family oxidoreductase n=1 Tax=Clostridium sp. B9 TaxID=3423224 RepID=UPI003D2ED442